MPDKHAQKVAAQLLTAGDPLLPADAKSVKEPEIIERDRQRQQRQTAQVAALSAEQRGVLPLTQRQ